MLLGFSIQSRPHNALTMAQTMVGTQTGSAQMDGLFQRRQAEPQMNPTNDPKHEIREFGCLGKDVSLPRKLWTSNQL